MQTFTTRHCNRKLSIVMALSTTFTQCAPETTKFGKITQNKGHFAVQGHSRLLNFGTNRKLIYDFLLVINTNLLPILHRFEDTSFQMLNMIAIFGYPSFIAFKPPDGGGSPGIISVKFSVDVTGWPRYQTAKKNCRKFQPVNRCMNVTDDRQTAH